MMLTSWFTRVLSTPPPPPTTMLTWWFTRALNTSTSLLWYFASGPLLLFFFLLLSFHTVWISHSKFAVDVSTGIHFKCVQIVCTNGCKNATVCLHLAREGKSVRRSIEPHCFHQSNAFHHKRGVCGVGLMLYRMIVRSFQRFSACGVGLIKLMMYRAIVQPFQCFRECVVWA